MHRKSYLKALLLRLPVPGLLREAGQTVLRVRSGGHRAGVLQDKIGNRGQGAGVLQDKIGNRGQGAGVLQEQNR